MYVFYRLVISMHDVGDGVCHAGARDRFCGRRSEIALAHDVARPFSPMLAIGGESPHYENAKLQGTGKMPVLRKARRLVVARASSPVPNKAPPRAS